MKILLIFLGLFGNQVSANCSIEPPIKGDGDAIGLIFVPGAKLLGSSYLPLLRSIQEFYPGSLWVGATTEWLGDMPNPIQIGGQIDDCITQAEAQGLDTTKLFFGGHSLGGIVLESYISGHADIAEGIALIGTWLPDLLKADNDFPVPVLTAIGELDGGGLSYLRREWEETVDLSEEKKVLTKTILVPQVNHGQVSSGEMPESVVDNDIDAELTEEEAHMNYGVRVADWLVLNTAVHTSHKWPGMVQTAQKNFEDYEKETEEFLAPFFAMHRQEQDGGISPFTEYAQALLMEVALSDQIEIHDSVLNAANFQVQSPNIVLDTQTGTVEVKTLTHFMYDLDPLDFNSHLSASTLKAKMKSADSIYSAVNLPEQNVFLACSELNQIALDMAMSVASETALNRLTEKGRSLSLLADEELSWGISPWETKALKWTDNGDGSVSLSSSRLTSDSHALLFPGLHYCDVLSPYRALEWIYVESLRHKFAFS